MRTQRIVLTVLLAAMIAPGVQASPAESFTINGLKIILARNTATEIVAVNLYIRGGATELDPREAGIEGMTLAVATEATRNYPKEKLHAALERMDTRIGYTTGLDYSSLSMQCVKQNLEGSWKIFADVLRNPSFEPPDVELVRSRFLSAIRQSQDDPDQYLNRLTTRAFYTDHPYATSLQGTVESVSAFSVADLRTRLQKRLTTSQLLLVVVGNVTREQVETMVKTSLGDLPAGTYMARIPTDPVHHESALTVVGRELPTNYIMGYFPTPGFGSADSYAMRIAIAILQQRLFEEVRTKRSLSYAPSAGVGPNFSNYGLIYVTAVNPDTTIKVMISELRRLQDERVPAKDLHDQINQYVTYYYLGMETNASQAELLARYELSGHGYAEAARIKDLIGTVTPDDMQRVCAKYIHNLQFVLIGNPATLQIGAFMF